MTSGRKCLTIMAGGKGCNMKIPPSKQEAKKLLGYKGNVLKLVVAFQILATSGVIHYQSIRSLTRMDNNQIDEALNILLKDGYIVDDGIEYHFKHLHFALAKD